MRLEGKTAIVVGAGQTLGETIGNGRATAILFAREGARVLLVDRDPGSVEETREMIAKEGGEAKTAIADITKDDQIGGIPQACIDAFGCIDILVNNVGIGSGDRPYSQISHETWDRIFNVNLTGMLFTCQAVVPHMREQGSGSVVNISSVASVSAYPGVTYKTSKAAVNAFTQHLAYANAKYGVRANAILPGLMDTPMAVGGRAAAQGRPAQEIRDLRNAQVPLKAQMGSGWDTAHAALFLASDEARFITGVLLPVDGGQTLKVG